MLGWLATIDVLVHPDVADVDREQLGDLGVEEAAADADFVDLHRKATLADIHIPQGKR